VRKSSDIVSLGEIMTPLIRFAEARQETWRRRKSSSRTKVVCRLGSFQGARSRDGGVSMGNGARHQATWRLPTNGNARRGTCGLCDELRHQGPRSSVRPIRRKLNVSEIELQGATVYRVNGLIDDCGKIVGEGQGPRPAGSIPRP